MATTTTRLALRKPATTDAVSVVTDVNDNADKLDAAVSAASVTSSTRPGSPFSGQLIYETDTKRLLAWSGSAWEQKAFDAFVCTSGTRPASPFTGLLIFQTDTLSLLVYTGSGWLALLDAAGSASQPRGNMGTPATTSTNGTTTSGGTNTRDAVLGDYGFTAQTGRLYRVTLDGLAMDGTTASDRFVYSIRDGGSSTPTSASPAILTSAPFHVVAASPAGRYPIHLEATFTATAGLHTLALFVGRNNGTGTATPVGTRSLYVEDIGSA